MAQGLYGHKAGDFRKALDREIEQLSTHSHREGARPGQSSPEQPPQRSARPPDTKQPPANIAERHAEAMGLVGAPGSPERWEYARSLAPETASLLENEQRVALLGLILDQWAQADDPDFYAEGVVREVARLAWDTQNTDVVNAARSAIEEIAGDADLFDSLMVHRLGVEQERQQQAHIDSEGDRMDGVRSQLSDEYERIEKTLGPAGLDSADQVAKELDAQGLLYAAETNPEHARLMMRAAAEAGQAETAAVRKYLAAAEIGAEMKRIGSPGSNWNDAERANWEAELDSAHLEVFDRATAAAQPDAAAARALASRQRELTGNTAFREALDAEIERMSTHSRDSEHANALRDAEVAAFEKSHDTGGEPIQDYDALERARQGG